MEDVNEAVKAFYCHKNAWATLSLTPLPMGDRTSAEGDSQEKPRGLRMTGLTRLWGTIL